MPVLNALSLRAVGVMLPACLAFLVVGGSPQAARAQHVVRVEEDWEMKVSQPNPGSSSPQVTVAFSPLQHRDSLHAILEMNHRTQPDYEAGGLSLQVWVGERLIGSRGFAGKGVLHHSDEKVRWTNVMELRDGALMFSVVNGRSKSWGKFGSDDGLRAGVRTDLHDLNRYHPKWSVDQSGVGFGGIRVEQLRLVRVRLYLKDGRKLEHELNLDAN